MNRTYSPVSIIGAPTDVGAGDRGGRLGPEALRIAGLGEALQARGYQVETIHGDLSQAQRDRVMRRFRTGQADILIATDVAARGLDIPEVSHVVNYDIPESAEAYVHRIGRTGRAGRTGEAITLVTPKETRWLRQIERIVRAKIEPKRLPTIADVAERRREAMKELILESLKEEDGYTSYLDTIDDLASDHDVAEVAAAILKLYAEETGRGTPEEKEDDLATFAAARTGRGESGMTRLFVNAGRNQNIRPQDIVGAIANEANIPGRSIGAIDILDTSTFVDVPTEFVDRVIQALLRSGVKGRPVNVEIANPEAGPPSRPSGRGGGGGPRFNRERDRDRGPRGGGGSRRFDRNRDRGRDHSGPPRFRVRRGE
jgi:ATP-dependent RNA helicase DeaD